MTPRAQAEREARLAREAAALRENLRRRKVQVRGVEPEVPLEVPAEGAEQGGG